MVDIIPLAILGAAAYFLYTGDLQKWLDQISQEFGKAIPKAPEGGPPAAGPPLMPMGPSGPISGGGTCPGGGITLHDDSQGGSKRMEAGNGVAWDAYEVTWCGTFSGDDPTFKMYGPSHSGSNCCWCVLHVKEDGKMVPGGEGPHPHSNCEHPSGSKGGGGKAPCYKAVIRPGPIQEGYALVGNQWQLRASYKGPCGCSQKASKRTGDTLMVRVDGQMSTRCATVRPLGGGGAAPGPPQQQAGVVTTVSPEYEFMPHVASVDETYTNNRVPFALGGEYFAGAGCGGLTGQTLAACKKVQGGGSIAPKKKPIVVPKNVPFGTKPRPKHSGGITPAPRKAGKGQPPATRATYEEEVRRNPCRAGESEDSCQRRRLADIKGNSPEAIGRRNAIIRHQWIVWARRKAIERLLARIRQQQQMTGGYRPVQFAGAPSGGGPAGGSSAALGGMLADMLKSGAAPPGLAAEEEKIQKQFEDGYGTCGTSGAGAACRGAWHEWRVKMEEKAIVAGTPYGVARKPGMFSTEEQAMA